MRPRPPLRPPLPPPQQHGEGGNHPRPMAPLWADIKKKARGWDTCHSDFLPDIVAFSNPSSFPIQEARDAQGRTCEGSIGLPVEVVPAMVHASGW